MQPEKNEAPVQPDPKATPLEVPATNTMDLPKRRGAGKTIMIVLLFVVLIAATAAGTWYYMTQKSKNQQAALQSQINDLNNSVQNLQTQNAALQAQAAIDLDTQVAINKTVKGFYDEWMKGLAANPATPKNTMAATALNKGYITAAVQKYINDSSGNPDPATCGTGAISSYSYAELAKNNNTASAVVSFNLAADVKSKAKINLVPQGSTWVISQITCSQ